MYHGFLTRGRRSRHPAHGLKTRDTKMLQGIVIGHATSTLKHPSLAGLRLAIVQPIGADDKPEADPQVVVDRLGAGPGQRVVVNSDGRAARELVGSDKTPVRFFVIAIVNDK